MEFGRLVQIGWTLVVLTLVGIGVDLVIGLTDTLITRSVVVGAVEVTGTTSNASPSSVEYAKEALNVRCSVRTGAARFASNLSDDDEPGGRRLKITFRITTRCLGTATDALVTSDVGAKVEEDVAITGTSADFKVFKVGFLGATTSVDVDPAHRSTSEANLHV